jgi:hypothetical protein
MFPAMFKTMKEVAAQRVDTAQDVVDRESALTSSKIKKRGKAGTKKFRVKFRAPFDRFTAEELGVTV